jgi:hypothetical protein
VVQKKCPVSKKFYSSTGTEAEKHYSVPAHKGRLPKLFKNLPVWVIWPSVYKSQIFVQDFLTPATLI